MKTLESESTLLTKPQAHFRLTEFILKWKIHDLKITNANEPMQNAFDEKFVVEFSLTSDEKHNFQVSTFPFGQVILH